MHCGGVEADLDGGVDEGFEVRGGREVIFEEGTEQLVRQVAQGAELVGDARLAAHATFEELGEDVRDLQEEVEVLGRLGGFGVGVFHGVAAVLLHVEAFVFGLPA